MRQVYENYTREDFEVWRILYDRQLPQLIQLASSEYLRGLKMVEFSPDRIPDFNQVNEILSGETGWELVVVPGIVPDYTFFELMSNKKFPATTWLRKKSQLDYLEEPDMFHDVFAHVPLLTNKPFCNFLLELSRIGLTHADNELAIELLSRVYWFTVEFGLIREDHQLKIYGAGILSSSGETRYCVSETPDHQLFSVTGILNTPYRKDEFQTRYFIVEKYDQLYESIPEVNRQLNNMLGNRSSI